MNPVVKEMWIKELSSGNYKYGSGSLVNVNSEGETQHCALGVLSELAFQHGILPIRGKDDSDDPFNSHYTGMHEWTHESLCPESVREWAGLSQQQTHKIAEVNDVSRKFSFYPTYNRVIRLIKLIPEK